MKYVTSELFFNGKCLDFISLEKTLSVLHNATELPFDNPLAQLLALLFYFVSSLFIPLGY